MRIKGFALGALGAAHSLSSALLSGCWNSSQGLDPATTVAKICLDPSIADEVARQKGAQDKALIAFFDAHEGDTVEFCEGQFNFTSGLTMSGKRGITIKGAGKGKTYLRFKDSPDQDYGNYEAPDATGTPPASWSTNGSYAFYPVLSHQVAGAQRGADGSHEPGRRLDQHRRRHLRLQRHLQAGDRRGRRAADDDGAELNGVGVALASA